MTDIVSPQKRSSMMSGIKGKDTSPEKQVRKSIFSRGFRYRLHAKDLPGKPDLVFPKYNTVVFVNGCFWHGHSDCHLFRYPKSKQEFWKNKIGGNIARDRKNIDLLLNEGWRIVIIWECTLKGKYRIGTDNVSDLLERILRRKCSPREIIEIEGIRPDNFSSTTRACGESRC